MRLALDLRPWGKVHRGEGDRVPRGLDAQTRDLMQIELLRVWQATRKTVLFVTHQIDEAVYLSDRVMVMTKRPGRAKKIFDIPLPRPRDYEMRTTPEFNALKLEIWNQLKDEIVI